MTAAKKPPGKGLVEKRARLLRSLDAHVRYLATADTLQPWSPPPREERPPRPPDPDPYRMRPASHFFTARERPELQHPAPGPEALSEEEVKAWVEGDVFVRSGLSPRTQRAMAFIHAFAPRRPSL